MLVILRDPNERTRIDLKMYEKVVSLKKKKYCRNCGHLAFIVNVSTTFANAQQNNLSEKITSL